MIEEQFLYISEQDILVIDISYKKKEKVELEDYKTISIKKLQSPTKKEYEHAFNKGQQHLLNGDCYQFNLTFPFYYSFNKEASISDFLGNLWGNKTKRAAYAHATYIPLWDKLYLSNSPECLFQGRRHLNGTHLWSMPIKGSLIDKSPNEFARKWEELVACKKNEAELFMITDLLRNDLSRIEKPTSRVVSKKLPLRVPGILHQYSLIDVILSSKVSFTDLLYALFPGGSITGAPKKSVMKILANIELEKRGFYCGSTIIWDQDIFASSINIRSAVVDFKKLECRYNAGGGITLRSELEGEFNEMHLKVSSFMNLLS